MLVKQMCEGFGVLEHADVERVPVDQSGIDELVEIELRMVEHPPGRLHQHLPDHRGTVVLIELEVVTLQRFGLVGGVAPSYCHTERLIPEGEACRLCFYCDDARPVSAPGCEALGRKISQH